MEQCSPSVDGFKKVSDSFIFSTEETESLLRELLVLEKDKWCWEGFATKRRVLRYNYDNECLPRLLQEMTDKFVNISSLEPPNQIVVEEYLTTSAVSSALKGEEVLTKFEASSCDGCATNDNVHCYVGQLVLVQKEQHNNVSVNQVFHLPKEPGRADCWHLQESAVVPMEPGCSYIKTKTCLWDWRSCIMVARNESSAENATKNGRVLVIKFSRLASRTAKSVSVHGPTVAATARQMSGISVTNSDTNGVVPVPEENGDNVEPCSSTTPPMPSPPLQHLLTLVITTSPIKSHPSTELLERTMETFSLGGDEFWSCSKIIVCDGIRIAQEDSTTVSKKHANVKQSLRNGIAPSVKHVENYREFKKRLRQKCESGEAPFVNCRFLELTERHGYGFSLREALNHVETKYVCVIQHDRTFMRPTPIKQVVHAMNNSTGTIKYVGMSMRSNLLYGDHFLSKYGKTYYDEFCDMVLYPPELFLEGWGPDSDSVRQMSLLATQKLQKNITDLALHYKKSMQYTLQQGSPNQIQDGLHQLSLTPTLFWYDNTHVCETAHYRDFIFNPTYKMVARGGFVEDKLSPVIAKSAQRMGLREGHTKFGCYLLDDHSGYFFTGHLDGGSYLTGAERQEFITVKKD